MLNKILNIFFVLAGNVFLLNRIFPNFGALSQAQYCSYSGHIYAARHPYHQLRPTPLSVEIVFHSESGICTIVSQPCFTTRNLRTKLCGIRSPTQKQQFVDPFKSWYLETRSDPEMENRLACGKHFSHKDSTKIWNGLYCITWDIILRIPDPESKTISRDGGVGR